MSCRFTLMSETFSSLLILFRTSAFTLLRWDTQMFSGVPVSSSKMLNLSDVQSQATDQPHACIK